MALLELSSSFSDSDSLVFGLPGTFFFFNFPFFGDLSELNLLSTTEFISFLKPVSDSVSAVSVLNKWSSSIFLGVRDFSMGSTEITL